MGTPLENIPQVVIQLSSRQFALFKPANEDQTSRLEASGYVEKQSGFFIRHEQSAEYDQLASSYIVIHQMPDFYSEKEFKLQWRFPLFETDPMSRHRASLQVEEKCQQLEDVARGLYLYTVRDAQEKEYTITLSNLPEGVYTDEQIDDLVKMVASINRSLPERKKIVELSFSDGNCGGSYAHAEQLRLPADRVFYDRLLHTVVHEMGHAFFDTLDNEQVERWNQLWQYSLGEGVAEIFDDSNYGDWPDTIGHPMDEADVWYNPTKLLLATELFATAFAAIVLHPEQIRLFMKNPQTTSEMKLLAQTAITELADLGFIKTSNVLYPYKGEREKLLRRVDEKIPMYVLQAMRSDNFAIHSSAYNAVNHYPRAEYAPELVQQFRSEEVSGAYREVYKNDVQMAVNKQKSETFRRLLSVYSVAPQAVTSLLSSNEVYQYALRTHSRTPIEYLVLTQDLHVNHLLQSPDHTIRTITEVVILEMRIRK